jgi:hypothetical protein
VIAVEAGLDGGIISVCHFGNTQVSFVFFVDVDAAGLGSNSSLSESGGEICV